MKGKKGQVTIFIIVGILIVAGIVIYLSSRNDSIKKQTFSSDSTQEVYSFVQDCLILVGKDMLFELGERGGYSNLSGSIISLEENVPYYLNNSRNLIPSKNTIENELAKLISLNLPFCINNFSNSSRIDPGLKISSHLDNITISFVKEKVMINADYSISIVKGANTETIDRVSAEIPLDFNKFYSQINETVSILLFSYPEICLNCLYDFSLKEGVSVNMLPYGNSTIMTLVSKNIVLDKKQYSWRFAFK